MQRRAEIGLNKGEAHHALKNALPHLTRSSLHRCLQRHGISRLPEIDGDKPVRAKFKA